MGWECSTMGDMKSSFKIVVRNPEE